MKMFASSRGQDPGGSSIERFRVEGAGCMDKGEGGGG